MTTFNTRIDTEAGANLQTEIGEFLIIEGGSFTAGGEPVTASVRCERIRITELDPASHIVVAGASHTHVIDSQVVLTISPIAESGQDILQRDGDGGVCAQVKGSGTLTAIGLKLQVCDLDTTFERILTGSAEIFDGLAPIGSEAPSLGFSTSATSVMEAWSRAWDGTGQAVLGPDPAYHHWVFPLVTGFVMRDLDLSSGVHLFSYEGIGYENAGIDPTGPVGDWPTPVVTHGGITRAWGHFLDVAIPVAA